MPLRVVPEGMAAASAAVEALTARLVPRMRVRCSLSVEYAVGINWS